MSHPEDAAAQALRLAAQALQQISTQSSSSDDDDVRVDSSALEAAPLDPITPTILTHIGPPGGSAHNFDKTSPKEGAAPAMPPSSPKLSDKLLSSVAQVSFLLVFGWHIRDCEAGIWFGFL